MNRAYLRARTTWGCAALYVSVDEDGDVLFSDDDEGESFTVSAVELCNALRRLEVLPAPAAPDYGPDVQALVTRVNALESGAAYADGTDLDRLRTSLRALASRMCDVESESAATERRVSEVERITSPLLSFAREITS